MKTFRQFAAALLVLSAALCAVAQERSEGERRIFREGNSWIEEVTGTLPAARNVRVETDMGSVRVHGATQQNITYVVRKRVYQHGEDAARRELENFRISGTRQGDTAVLQGEWNNRGSRRAGADFNITVPQNLELVKVETRGGSVDVNNIAGRADAETAGGSIQLDNIGGAVAADTAGGSISVGTAGGETRLKTAGGSIQVNTVNGRLTAATYGGSVDVNIAKQAANIDTAGGSIHVRQTGGELRASTAGGNIEAGDIGGPATLKTAGGSIRLNSARGPVDASTAGGGIQLTRVEGGVHAETAAGGIVAEFVGAKMTDSYLETTVGDVIVTVPSNLACTIRGGIEMASGHGIRSDFPELKITTEGGEYGPKQVYVNGNLNGGGPTLKLRTNIGDIEIRRASR